MRAREIGKNQFSKVLFFSFFATFFKKRVFHLLCSMIRQQQQQQQQSVKDVEDKLRVVGSGTKFGEEEKFEGVTKKSNGGTLKVNFAHFYF